jgi:hypothetical protein
MIPGCGFFLQENEKSENNNDTQFLVMTTMLAVPSRAKVAPIHESLPGSIFAG